MASPQKEHGHTPIANELMEAFARVGLNGTQFRLVMVILRKTYGWNKKRDTISLSQFAEASGIHRTQVARELGRLAARRIITEWGDDHHPKQYGIQKDYTRWLDDEKVSTNPLTLAGKVSTDSLQSVNGLATKVSTDPLPTKARKATLQKQETTDSHESAASGTLFQRVEQKYRESTNKTAVLGELFSLLLGDAPDYRRIGSMAKRLNSGGKLIRLIIDASQQTISDNPHDYLDKMVTRELAKESGNAVSEGPPNRHRRQAGRTDRRLALGAPGSHGPGGHDSWSEGE